MKTRLLLLASCLLAFAGQAQESKVQMWTWTDANGVVHYSDVPGPGAVRVGVSVSKGQPGTAPAVPGSDAGQGEGRGEGRGEARVPRRRPRTPRSRSCSRRTGRRSSRRMPWSTYRSHPIRRSRTATASTCTSTASVSGTPGDAMGYSLSSLERGEHTLSAAIVDSQGTEKIRSQSVVFYMKQQTIYDSKPAGSIRPTSSIRAEAPAEAPAEAHAKGRLAIRHTAGRRGVA